METLETHQRGRIVGTVKYREGDGVDIEIPHGPCDMAVTDLDVTLTWTDDGIRGSAAIPLADYRQYIASGALRIER